MPNFSIKNGYLYPAGFIESPNQNARPNDEISLIVIHNISLPPSQFGQSYHGVHYVSCFFQNKLPVDAHPYFDTIKNLQVSAHLFITRSGDVTQYVNFLKRAWHAGLSSYLGRKNCNDFSIGIELEGDDTSDYTKVQYDTLAQIIAAINTAYPYTKNHIAGHCDIARGRKTDPGVFNWTYLRQKIIYFANDTCCANYHNANHDDAHSHNNKACHHHKNYFAKNKEA